jgi:hypothetical protein
MWGHLKILLTFNIIINKYRIIAIFYINDSTTIQINAIKALSIKQINKWNCFFDKWREFLIIWEIYIFKNTKLTSINKKI